jgi:hypothetical protein
MQGTHFLLLSCLLQLAGQATPSLKLLWQRVCKMHAYDRKRMVYRRRRDLDKNVMSGTLPASWSALTSLGRL